MKKYIIREVEPEACEFGFYFDDDGLTEASGDWNNNLFIISNEGYGRISGFNIETYKNVQRQAETIIDGFDDVNSGVVDYDGKRITFKSVMEEAGITYNARKCHAMKEWAKDADTGKTDDIAAFLTITTGKKWDTASAHGYSQGDYVEMVYCPENYKDGVKAYGEVWLGAAKEFGVIELDENGEEIDSCYGYIVADCQAWKDEDYKRLVCEWACIDPAETQLEMIDSCQTVTHYSYRTA